MSTAKEQLINNLNPSFLKVAFEDMSRALKENTNLAVFILGVCLIDSLSGFRFGKIKKGDHKDGKRFKNFVKIYLKQYNANDLWKIRNDLLHSYATEKYGFVNKKLHLHNKLVNRKKFINDEDFYSDLKTAYRNFINDLCNGTKEGEVCINVNNRLSKFGLMKIEQIK